MFIKRSTVKINKILTEDEAEESGYDDKDTSKKILNAVKDMVDENIKKAGEIISKYKKDLSN